MIQPGPGPPQTEEECPLRNIFFAPDYGSNPPHAEIFFAQKITFHDARPQVFKKCGNVLQP